LGKRNLSRWKKRFIMKSPFGYACHKVLYGRQGEPEDYIFLEVNPAFEEMTGLKSEAILGKRVTEVLPGIRAGGFDWVAFYGKVALTGERQEYSQYAEQPQAPIIKGVGRVSWLRSKVFRAKLCPVYRCMYIDSSVSNPGLCRGFCIG
jgi:PAS domain-containing protein